MSPTLFQGLLYKPGVTVGVLCLATWRSDACPAQFGMWSSQRLPMPAQWGEGGREGTMPQPYVGQGQTLLVSMRKSWFWNICLNPSLGSVFFFRNQIICVIWNHKWWQDPFFFPFGKIELYYFTHQKRVKHRRKYTIYPCPVQLPTFSPHPNQPSRPAFTQRSSAGHFPDSKDVNKPRLKGLCSAPEKQVDCLRQVNITCCRMRQPPAKVNRPWYAYFLGARETAELLILAYSLILSL